MQNFSARHAFIESQWNDSIRSSLEAYIRIPNLSPHFDPAWHENGHMMRVMELLQNWITTQNINGLSQKLVQQPGETPLLFIEIPGTIDETVLLYGHTDKQPPLNGWREGLDAFTPVIEGDRLYGRGAADDGYAVFSAITAIKTLQQEGAAHPRCVIIIEACEESGSYNLASYIEMLSDDIGQPKLIICLDSGCGSYDRMWLTSSLRGVVTGKLHVEVLKEGVHSGDASGVVPSSFRIARQLLSRLEDENTGKILHDDFHVAIPAERKEQIEIAAEVLKDEFIQKYSWVEGMRPATHTVKDAITARTWQPALSITGADGIPAIANAGNVLRSHTDLKLSMRIPPGVDAERAAQKMKEILEQDPPYGAKVSFTADHPGSGWDAPAMQPWLRDAVESASQACFGNPLCVMGEGGSIPFMYMLGQKYPDAQFVITGVLGPEANAHGPNEFLHIPTFKKITAAVAHIIERVGTRT